MLYLVCFFIALTFFSCSSTKIDTEIQKQQVREKFEELKKENNLMKYIHNLVKEIKFFEDRKIQINCMFKIDSEFQF